MLGPAGQDVLGRSREFMLHQPTRLAFIEQSAEMPVSYTHLTLPTIYSV